MGGWNALAATARYGAQQQHGQTAASAIRATTKQPASTMTAPAAVHRLLPGRLDIGEQPGRRDCARIRQNFYCESAWTITCSRDGTSTMSGHHDVLPTRDKCLAYFERWIKDKLRPASTTKSLDR